MVALRTAAAALAIGLTLAASGHAAPAPSAEASAAAAAKAAAAALREELEFGAARRNALEERLASLEASVVALQAQLEASEAATAALNANCAAAPPNAPAPKTTVVARVTRASAGPCVAAATAWAAPVYYFPVDQDGHDAIVRALAEQGDPPLGAAVGPFQGIRIDVEERKDSLMRLLWAAELNKLETEYFLFVDCESPTFADFTRNVIDFAEGAMDANPTSVVFPLRRRFKTLEQVVDRSLVSYMHFEQGNEPVDSRYFGGSRTALERLSSMRELAPLYEDERLDAFLSRLCVSAGDACVGLLSADLDDGTVSAESPVKFVQPRPIKYPSPLSHIHFPKTGSSLENLLFMHMCPREAHRTDYKYERKPSVFLEKEGYSRCKPIHGYFENGHAPFSTEDWERRSGHVVTMLRDPYARIVSGFFHDIHSCRRDEYGRLSDEERPKYAWLLELDRHNPTPEMVLRYANMTGGCMTRMMTGRRCCTLDPTDRDLDPAASDISERAIKHLREDVAFIGITDDFQGTKRAWRRLFNQEVAPFNAAVNTRPNPQPLVKWAIDVLKNASFVPLDLPLWEVGVKLFKDQRTRDPDEWLPQQRRILEFARADGVYV